MYLAVLASYMYVYVTVETQREIRFLGGNCKEQGFGYWIFIYVYLYLGVCRRRSRVGRVG